MAKKKKKKKNYETCKLLVIFVRLVTKDHSISSIIFYSLVWDIQEITYDFNSYKYVRF